jgi:integrase
MPRRTRLPSPTRTDTGSWAVRWRAAAGDAARPKRTFRTRAEAEAFIRDHLAPNPGRDWQRSSTPFCDYVAAWLAACEVKPRTRDGYAHAVKHASRHFDTKPVGDISVRDAREFLAVLKATPSLRTARSIRYAWWPFRSVLALAVADQAISANPADAVKLPTGQTYRDADDKPVRRFQARFLSESEVEHLATTFAPPYDVMVKMLAWTGLRAAELAGLDVADCKLWRTQNGWRGHIDVHRTRRKVKGGWAEDTPKSVKSRRTVRLASWLAEDLHTYLSTCHPRGDTADAPLFPNRRRGGYTRGTKVLGSTMHGALNWGEPVEPSAFYRNVFKDACTQAGLPPLRLHDLRHTYASISLTRGEDIYRLSEQMGHATYRVTLDVYAHLIPRDDDAGTVLDMRPEQAREPRVVVP